MFTTPIQLLISTPNRLYIKREDLLPICFGGNKYRIANEYLKDMYRLGMDCIVSYGNPRSNLCRVLSMLCYSHNIPCFIISPDDGDGNRAESYNKKLSQISNAQIIQCDKKNVSASVENVLSYCENIGLKPYYIYGDIYGKGNEKTPVEAYFQVYKNELHSFVIDKAIDYVFLPVGTGMTIAGLAVASEVMNDNIKLVGISIAREKKKAMDNVSLFCNSYLEGMDLSNLCIVDDYIMGGYGKYNEGLKDKIFNYYNQFGISMDPTYVGKAFFGMDDWILKNNIHDSNILFIHTGGLPLWFDLLNSLKGESQ